jgi:mono/diheme cytochrome c family protein
VTATYRITAILAATLLLALPASADEELEFGRMLVETNCRECHAVTRTDESAHPDAPELRTLSARYPIDALEEAFVEGIYVGHPDMPEFIATPEQVAAIVAYIESIQD